MYTDEERERIFKACTRQLAYHYTQTPRQVLSELAEATDPAWETDRYGTGQIINSFEAEIATLLGKEAAIFMPSGTMCQQIALRVWCERRKTPNVAFHPTCHLEIHEQHAYQRLHALNGILLGEPQRLFTLADLQAVTEPLGALLVELPQREIGGQLPDWETLTAIMEWARVQGIPTHLDGARLWECRPFYGRDYAGIAALFDTVYVSFYKILGGIAGSILAGPHDIIAEARTWQRRHGGNLVQLYPFVLSARKGLNERLGRMELYYEKAQEIAAVLSAFPRVSLLPNPPQTNMLHIFLQGDRQALNEAALEIARETKTRLFRAVIPTQVPGYQMFELSVGDAALDLSREEIASLFELLFTKA